jgi:hypothetical protein
MVIMKGKNGSVKLRLPLVAAFVAAFVVAPAFAVPTGLLKAKTASKVPVEVFLMSKCSYCVDVLMSVRPLLDTYGSAIDYRQAFIAKETSPGTFQSMHGDGEVQGDLAMLCMERYYKKDYGYMDAVLCMIAHRGHALLGPEENGERRDRRLLRVQERQPPQGLPGGPRLPDEPAREPGRPHRQAVREVPGPGRNHAEDPQAEDRQAQGQ